MYAKTIGNKVPACIIILLALSLVSVNRCSTQQESVAMSETEMMVVPEEFMIYLGYMHVIGGIPHISDIATIEATVLAITKTEVYPGETDPFAPEPKPGSIAYPKDLGIVKIDKIIDYTPYRQRISKSPIEQTTGSDAPEEKTGKTVPGSKGTVDEYPSKRKVYISLREGKEVPTHFLLTARPAKVKYVPLIGEGNLESEELSVDSISQKTVTHRVEGRRAFKPLPKEDGYLVFTTKVGEFPNKIEKILPGLRVGEKFRAEINYDGSLYIKEYEIVSKK